MGLRVKKRKMACWHSAPGCAECEARARAAYPKTPRGLLFVSRPHARTESHFNSTRSMHAPRVHCSSSFSILPGGLCAQNPLCLRFHCYGCALLWTGALCRCMAEACACHIVATARLGGARIHAIVRARAV